MKRWEYLKKYCVPSTYRSARAKCPSCHELIVCGISVTNCHQSETWLACDCTLACRTFGTSGGSFSNLAEEETNAWKLTAVDYLQLVKERNQQCPSLGAHLPRTNKTSSANV